MNLAKTVQAMEACDIVTAIDLGIHGGCSIDSNCPLAIELRKLITSSGISITDLLDKYAEMQVDKPDPLAIPELTPLSTNANINIGNSVIPIDISTFVNSAVNNTIRTKLTELRGREEILKRVMKNLYSSYLQAIEQSKKSKSLPQLAFSVADMLKFNCSITTDGTNYLFLFPFTYNPKWAVRKGIRYELREADIIAIKRECSFVFPVTPENKIQIPYIVTNLGSKFTHYHGRGGDCWGHIKLPELWDKRLKSLSNLAISLEGALATINMDSLMERNPSGMPSSEEMFSHCKELGEEGVINPVPAEVAAVPEETPPRRWGNGVVR